MMVGKVLQKLSRPQDPPPSLVLLRIALSSVYNELVSELLFSVQFVRKLHVSRMKLPSLLSLLVLHFQVHFATATAIKKFPQKVVHYCLFKEVHFKSVHNFFQVSQEFCGV